MSASPIGTLVPKLSPNSIIRAGIPLSDNFNATDVSISVASLLAEAGGEGGEWFPTFSDFSGAIASATLNLATYSKAGSIVTCTIQGSVTVDFSSPSGSFDLTLPVASASYQTIGCVNIESPKQCNGIIKSGGRLVLSSEDATFSNSGIPFYAILQYVVS